MAGYWKCGSTCWIRVCCTMPAVIATLAWAFRVPAAPSDAPLAAAKWIAPPAGTSASGPLPLVRKEFAVSGKPINPTAFVEYEGKKVYLCCPGCPDAFKADPKKFLAKLPQFAKDGGESKDE